MPQASNVGALNLYERLGFAREERMAKLVVAVYRSAVLLLISDAVSCRYYLNGGDAFRLKLWLDRPLSEAPQELTDALSNATVAAK